jgi:hypothetical protein
MIEKTPIPNGHGGRRPGAGRPRKDVPSAQPAAWLAELGQLRDAQPCSKNAADFTDLVLQMLDELAATTSRRGEMAALIAAEMADHDPRRRRKIVLAATTLEVRSQILLTLIEAAARVQRVSGRKFPSWDSA